MKHAFYAVILLAFSFSLNAQTNLNLALKSKLDSLYIVDQKYRSLLILKNHGKGDSLARALNVPVSDLEGQIWKLINEADLKNLLEVEKIIQRYGYPGKSLVGTPTNIAAYFVIQHSQRSKIEEYIPVIEKAAKDKEIPFSLYAMMQDRLLMYQEKEQIYGTQVSGFRKVDSTGKQTEIQMFVWPIQDPLNVNSRRKEAGFDTSVEENAQRLGVQYKTITMEELRKMRGM